jgi:hypothetical protein
MIFAAKMSSECCLWLGCSLDFALPAATAALTAVVVAHWISHFLLACLVA